MEQILIAIALACQIHSSNGWIDAIDEQQARCRHRISKCILHHMGDMHQGYDRALLECY